MVAPSLILSPRARTCSAGVFRRAEQSGRPSLRLLVLHDDPDREFDYLVGAEQALQLASTRAWTVISIKDDWTTVF